MAAPVPLSGNLSFAFRGEPVEPARVLAPATARRIAAGRNATGKPNTDVLRSFTGLALAGTARRRTVLDFPATLSPAEMHLYAAPAAWLDRAGLPPANPHANPSLRTALARLERFLAAPANASAGFDWIEGDVLPDDSLVVWARDDDFSSGVLASRAFALWVDTSPDLLAALRSYPFPWAPATPLSALSRIEEENYFALARAARAGDEASIEEAVLAAYRCPPSLDDSALLARLRELHSARLRAGG